MTKPRIFLMDDWTWYAAYSPPSALIAYRKDCRETYSAENIHDVFDPPIELTDIQMLNTKYRAQEDGALMISFAERLQQMIDDGHEFPCFFATTEY